MLAAGTRCTEHLHANVGLVHFHVWRGHVGPHLDERETRLAAALVVERTDAYQPVHSALGGHEPVGVATPDGELSREKPRFGALARLFDLDGEPSALGPTAVHAQEDLGPVLRIDATIFGVDLHDGIVGIVFTGEETAQIEQVETRCDLCDACFDLGLL